MLNRRLYALVEAVFVTFLWSTSYILIKIGLREINSIAFASYRYALASALLLMLVFSKVNTVKNLDFNNY